MENTSNDLQDCVENWYEKLSNDYEKNAKKKIIRLARKIVEMEGEED